MSIYNTTHMRYIIDRGKRKGRFEMTKLFIDILADKSYNEMCPQELKSHAYGVKYYQYQGHENETHGLSYEKFVSRRAEMLTLIEAAARAPQPDLTAKEERMATLRRQRQARRAGTVRPCTRCGNPASMSTSSGASCSDCYDELSNG
jgi:hypothetical protein